MRKVYLSILAIVASLGMGACFNNYDDFDFVGTVIDVEVCTQMPDIGLAIQLDAPDSIGGTYYATDGKYYNNTVVVYRPDRIAPVFTKLSGRIALDPNYSKSMCNYHWRETTGDVPEAIFTKMVIED